MLASGSRRSLSDAATTFGDAISDSPFSRRLPMQRIAFVRGGDQVVDRHLSGKRADARHHLVQIARALAKQTHPVGEGPPHVRIGSRQDRERERGLDQESVFFFALPERLDVLVGIAHEKDASRSISADLLDRAIIGDANGVLFRRSGRHGSEARDAASHVDLARHHGMRIDDRLPVAILDFDRNVVMSARPTVVAAEPVTELRRADVLDGEGEPQRLAEDGFRLVGHETRVVFAAVVLVPCEERRIGGLADDGLQGVLLLRLLAILADGVGEKGGGDDRREDESFTSDQERERIGHGRSPSKARPLSYRISSTR